MSSDSDPRYITSPAPACIERAKASHVLDATHQSVFKRAVQNVLSTTIAETTFAQIIDGLPLRSVALGTSGLDFHGAIYDHEHLYPGAFEKAISFRSGLDYLSIELQVTVLQRYQDTPVGSRASQLPLIELVAVTIHRLATLLYKSGSYLKERDLQEDQLCCSARDETHPYPTPFVLHEYGDVAQYKEEGVAEMPGYWAEDQIFGGVVLFHRGESGFEVSQYCPPPAPIVPVGKTFPTKRIHCDQQCNSVWLHPFREELTYRICELTSDQISDLLTFFASEQQPGDSASSPLPVMVDKKNLRRVEYEVAIPEYNIYRDRWERVIRYEDYEEYVFMGGSGCVLDEVNHPDRGGDLEYFADLDNPLSVKNRTIPGPKPGPL